MRVRHQFAAAAPGREPPPQPLLRARVQRAAAREAADGRFGMMHGGPVCARRFYTAPAPGGDVEQYPRASAAA